jgi:hypothetical protein
MSSISNWLSPDSGFLKIAIVAAVVVAAALILAVVYRLVFGHRLRVPGASRARQPRLGLVDAFSLDGQRQLVLVRRDNVEHLVMIGGPNDVLLESQIVRAVAAAPREPSLKPPVAVGEAPHAPAEGGAPRVEAPMLRRVEPTAARAPAVRPAPSPVREPPPRVEPAVAVKVEPPPARSEPAPLRPVAVARPEPAPARAAPPPPVTPLAPPAAAPLAVPPPRPAAPARAGLPPPIGTPPAIRGRATPLPTPHEGPTAVSPPPVAPPARPDAAPARPDAAPAAPPPPAEAGATGKPKGDDPFADLESLEAEMARLLGRGG